MFLSLFNDMFQLHSNITYTAKKITLDGKDFKGNTIPHLPEETNKNLTQLQDW
jgi:hypothetical protein